MSIGKEKIQGTKVREKKNHKKIDKIRTLLRGHKIRWVDTRWCNYANSITSNGVEGNTINSKDDEMLVSVATCEVMYLKTRRTHHGDISVKKIHFNRGQQQNVTTFITHLNYYL